jgi:glycosyltransferase involved in cell wall biosynthesis
VHPSSVSSTRSDAEGTRPPAVLQVLPRLVAGGVERGTVEVAAALVAAGWSSWVASEGGPMVHELEKAGAQHIALPLASKNPLVMRRNVGRLAKLIRNTRIDVLHARSRAPAWSAAAAARRTGCHLVTSFHNVYGAGTALRRWYNSVMGRGERVIAISQFVAENAVALYGVAPERLRIVHRGVDLQRFDPTHVFAERIVSLARSWRLPDGAPVVMLPGRLTRWKGQLDLVDALARLGRRDIRCLLVGSDEGKTGYRREIEERVRQHRLENVVGIVDHCADMPAAYMLADVVVSASNRPEGFGRVAIEAQAMGRPVIATGHGGARETIIDGETGWLVPPSDPEAMAGALVEALSLTGGQRQDLAVRARGHVAAHFSTAAMCAAEIAVYEELLFPESHRVEAA